MNALSHFKSRLLVAALALICCCASASAQYKALQLNEVFLVKNFGDDRWSYTATKDATIKIVGAVEGEYFAGCVDVFDASFSQNIANFYFGNPSHYEFQVKSGKTYYIVNNNWSGADIHAKLVMGEDFGYAGATPADNDRLFLTNPSQVTFSFTSSSIDFTDGELYANGNKVKIYNFNDYNDLVREGIFTYTQVGLSGVVNWNGHLCAHVENGLVVDFTTATGYSFTNVLLQLFQQGKLAEGDPITIKMHGIRSLLTGELLNGDGELEVSWAFGGGPTLLEDATVPGSLPSWSPLGNPSSMAAFTFSKDIVAAQAELELGDEESGDVYIEQIDKSRIVFDGTTVKVDLGGVMRTQRTMGLLSSYASANLRLYSVVDIDGNETFCEDLGVASSYTFHLSFRDSETYTVTMQQGDTYQTLSLPFNAEIPAGVNVYSATLSANGLGLAKEDITVLPANTAVLVSAPAGTYQFRGTTATATPLKGSNVLQPTGIGNQALSSLGWNNIYLLAKENGGEARFYRYTVESRPVPACKAFLRWTASHAAPAYIRINAEDLADGIRAAETNETDTYYDLSGRPANPANHRGVLVKKSATGNRVIIK